MNSNDCKKFSNSTNLKSKFTFDDNALWRVVRKWMSVNFEYISASDFNQCDNLLSVWVCFCHYFSVISSSLVQWHFFSKFRSCLDQQASQPDTDKQKKKKKKEKGAHCFGDDRQEKTTAGVLSCLAALTRQDHTELKSVSRWKHWESGKRKGWWWWWWRKQQPIRRVNDQRYLFFPTCLLSLSLSLSLSLFLFAHHWVPFTTELPSRASCWDFFHFSLSLFLSFFLSFLLLNSTSETILTSGRRRTTALIKTADWRRVWR